jgi:hypothetical protein
LWELVVVLEEVLDELLDLFESVLSLLAKIQRKLHHFNLLIDFTNLGPGTCDTIKAQANRSITSGCWPNVKFFPSLGSRRIPQMVRCTGLYSFETYPGFSMTAECGEET